MFATIGNHDTPGSEIVPPYGSNGEDSISFRKYFNFSPSQANPDYYSFTLGNSSFIGFNSELPAFYGRFPERDQAGVVKSQEEWMVKELEKASQEKTWVFSFFHIPAINPPVGKTKLNSSFPIPSISTIRLIGPCQDMSTSIRGFVPLPWEVMGWSIASLMEDL